MFGPFEALQTLNFSCPELQPRTVPDPTNFHVNPSNLKIKEWVRFSVFATLLRDVGWTGFEGAKHTPVHSDFGDRWLVLKVLLRAITYQKFTSLSWGVSMVRAKTCAKNAFSHRSMHKVGSPPMAISRQRSGIFSNGQKWRMRDSSEHKDQQ